MSPPLTLPRDVGSCFICRVNSESIEDSLFVAPKAEQHLFSTRNQFDAVVLCDEKSTSINASAALMALMRAVYEVEFKKVLRNMPIILVGGISAWRNELGPDEMTRGGTDASHDVGLGLDANIPSTAGSVSPHLPAPIPRMNGMMQPLAPLPSPSLASSAVGAHVRTPAESSTSAQYGSPLVDTTNMSRTRSGGEQAPDANAYRMWVPPPNAATPDIPQYRCVYVCLFHRRWGLRMCM